MKNLNIILGTIIFALFNLIGCVQATTKQKESGKKQITSINDQKSFTDIKQVDFRNYTYKTSITKEFDWNKEVVVKNGKFDERQTEKNGDFYFGVKVMCVDIDNDEKDEAIIIESCGRYTYNWDATEILIYKLIGKRPVMISKLNFDIVKQDYLRYYSNTDVLWSITDVHYAFYANNIVVELASGGNHAQPKYDVTIKYTLTNNKLIINEKPEQKIKNYSE